jgi:Tol biopolymer transport system component
MPLRLPACPLALALLTAAALFAAAGAAPAAVLAPDTTSILSGAPSLLAPLPAPVADSFPSPQAVSADGRYVAFSSRSDGLSDEDDDDGTSIYVRDRLTGTTTLVSRATGAHGEPSHGLCIDPAISDDGTRVGFVCTDALDPADTNDGIDVYVRDLRTDETILVSQQGGVSGALDFPPALSGDGTRVAFTSRAPFAGALQAAQQVYVRDIPLGSQPALGPIALVSRGGGAGQTLPDGVSGSPSISNDGTRVAFLSQADNIAAGATLQAAQAFVRDLSATPPTTTLVSRQSGGGAVAEQSVQDAIISGDGTAVAFVTPARNLDPGATDLRTHVYLHAGQTTTLLDRSLDGVKAGNAGANELGIDDHGDVVAFVSRATDLVDPALDGAPGLDTFAWDARGATPRLRLVSRASGASARATNATDDGPSVSGDGTFVLFTSQRSVTGDAVPGIETLGLRSLDADTTSAVVLPTGATTFSNAGGFAGDASVSADGRYVAFVTGAPALGVPPADSFEIVVRDTETGAVALASREDGADGAPMSAPDIERPSISADGQRVAFEAADAAGVRQVWVRDLAHGTTTLASRGIDGAPADGGAQDASLSADGTHVAFVARSTNLVAGVADGEQRGYVRDLRPGGGTALVADDGTPSPPFVASVVLNGDGTRAAFVTNAGLVPGDTDDLEDLYVRDLTPGGQTVLASVGSDGANSDKLVEDPAISADGTHVAFATPSRNLGTAGPANTFEVWVRDLRPGGTSVLASRADSAIGAVGNGDSTEPALSADGHVVVFGSGADNLGFALDGPSPFEVYRRDLSTELTQLVSRRSGPQGAAVSASGESSRVADVTADGGCVVFDGFGDVVGPFPGVLDFPQVYLRAFEPNCGRPVPPPPPTGGGPGPDRTPPVLRSVSLTHKRFRVGKARTAVSAAAAAKRKPAIPRGTVLRFTSSEAGRLTLLIERARPGQKVRRGRAVVCKAVRRKPRRGACTAYARTATLTRAIRAGRGSVALSGRIGTRAMAPGAYRLTLTARDKAGNASKPVRLTFTVLRG